MSQHMEDLCRADPGRSQISGVALRTEATPQDVINQSTGPDRRYWAQIADRASNFDIIDVPISPEAASECEIDFDDELESMCFPTFGPSESVHPPIQGEMLVASTSDSLTEEARSETTPVECPTNSDTLDFSSLYGRLHHPANSGTHWYGATSHLHYSRNTLLASLCRPAKGFPTESNRVFETAVATSEIDADGEKSLEDLFFSWQNLALHGISQEEYIEAKDRMKAGQNAQLCSPALVSAILAVSAPLASRTSFRLPKGQRPAEYFAQRARRLLENEIDNPTLATVHAILVLCIHDMAEANDSRGAFISPIPTTGYCGETLTIGGRLAIYRFGIDSIETVPICS